MIVQERRADVNRRLSDSRVGRWRRASAFDSSPVLDYKDHIVLFCTNIRHRAVSRSAARTAPRNVAKPQAEPDRLSGPALRTFFRIADEWELSSDEARTLLGSPPRSTFFLWKKTGHGQLGRDTLERVSYILGIYKALQILLPDAAAADTWVRKPNAAPIFGGKPALERMLSGNVADLYVVRQYLDAWRGG